MIYLILSIILIGLDQITKYLAASYLIKNPIGLTRWFKLVYLENKGAAFGILEGKQTFFIILTVVVILTLVIYVYNNRLEFSNFEKFTLCLFISGAIGNFIDRILNGYVIDFISVRLFNLYNFPVFNLADTYISLAGIIFVLLYIFGDKK